MSDRKFNISPAEARRLYKTIKDVHDTLLANNIPYFVTGGTLIGAIRHRGIVPWDDDGDICIMKKDVPKLRSLIPYFKSIGYGLDAEEDKTAECMLKDKNSCTFIIEPFSKNALAVDIFVMERVGPLLTYADPYWRDADNGGKACYFLAKFIFPLVPVRFGNFWVMTPHNAIEHLNQCYGVNWNSHSMRLFDHREGRWIDSKPKRMLATDYETIPAPKSTCETQPPSVPCKSTYRSNIGIKNLTKAELRFIGRDFGIKGYKTMSQSKLRAIIEKL